MNFKLVSIIAGAVLGGTLSFSIVKEHLTNKFGDDDFDIDFFGDDEDDDAEEPVPEAEPAK